MVEAIEKAIIVLGNGFLKNAPNQRGDFLYQGTLQLVFRICFLWRAETAAPL